MTKIPISKLDSLEKVRNSLLLSFRRKPEFSDFSTFWMPDQVRHDDLGTFYEFIKLVWVIEY